VRPAAALRSAALALLIAAAAASVAGVAEAAPPPPRFAGQVTDALRTPAHLLAVSADSGRAVADLVFIDREAAGTSVRSCVKRRDVVGVSTCFTITTGAAGVATVTPLRFPPGRYEARWKVAGALVASWRFRVV
jgi:hypothetical protein